MNALGTKLCGASAACLATLTMALVLVLLAKPASGAVLTHRYPFDTNGLDVVGGANATISSPNYLTNGGVQFVPVANTSVSVQLPANLFTNYDSITFEAWFVDCGSSASLFDPLYQFGQMICYLAYKIGYAAETVYFLPAPVAVTNHLVWTQDSTSQTARVFLNGVMTGENTNFTLTPALMGPTSDSLGGSGFVGSLLEFRVYQGALSKLEVAETDAAGPDQLPVNPGALQAVRLLVPSPIGPGASVVPAVFADFANLTNVNIIGQPDLILSSDNTSALSVTANQRLFAAGLGVANVTAFYQGVFSTVGVTITGPQDVALLHRYSFSEPISSHVAYDSVGSAHGRLLNPGIRFSGMGEMLVDSGGYLCLPPGLVSSQSEATIEAWVTWTGNGFFFFPRIFDFGSQAAGWGHTYIYLTGNRGGWLHATITTNSIAGETPILNWTNAMLNITSHVAVSYSPVRRLAKLYLNGAAVDAGIATIPLGGIIDTNAWLGRSQFRQDSYFSGRFNEFRLYGGMLSDADVKAEYAAGPDSVGVDFMLHAFVANGGLTITWGLSASNLTLESSPVLGGAAAWTPVAASPTLQNGRLQVTLPLPATDAYFRLHAL